MIPGSAGRAAAGGPGPDLCNTGPPNRHPWLPPGETGGVDTLHVSVYGQWDPEAYAKLRETLNELRSVAEGAKTNEAAWELPDGSTALVQPSGSKLGGTYYRWILTWQGNRVYLADRKETSDKWPIAYVQFKSLPLMQLGHVELWLRFKEFLASIGAEVEREVVSRVDPCVDLLDGIGELWRMIANGQTITRANKVNMHGPNFAEAETIQFGAKEAAVKCRIYDKTEELMGEGVDKAAKCECLRQKRWGVESHGKCMRVEFQIMGEALKEHFNVRTMTELEDAWPHIIAWLMGHEDGDDKADDTDVGAWLRITADSFDRRARNYSRDAKTAPEWKVVRQAFYAWINNPTTPVPLPAKQATVPSSERLLKQAAGCWKKAAAMAEAAYANAEEMLDWAWNSMKPFFGGQQDFEDVMQLRTECETNHGQVFWETPFAPEVPEPFPEFAADQNREPQPLASRAADWKKGVVEVARHLWGDEAAYDVTINLAGT